MKNEQRIFIKNLFEIDKLIENPGEAKDKDILLTKENYITKFLEFIEVFFFLLFIFKFLFYLYFFFISKNICFFDSPKIFSFGEKRRRTNSRLFSYSK